MSDVYSDIDNEDKQICEICSETSCTLISDKSEINTCFDRVCVFEGDNRSKRHKR